MVTVQEIFDAAMDLMDEANESTGSTDTADTKEYRIRTISILNTAIPKLHPYSSNYHAAATTGRPRNKTLMADNRSNPDFEQSIPLDDALCWSLLPYFLASILRSGEDTEFSMRMMTEYNNAFLEIRDKSPAEFEPISTPYGMF
ncbi:MAG: hypothetical protein J6Q53_04785 [Oscillospiraceae bacterium]|nr:hypothetical protein [Oscillospiraceae bacterium]